MSVTVIIGKRHALAGLFLFVFAALAGGALIAPPGTEALTTTYTRSASCAGLDFYPTDSRTAYDNDGPLRVRRYEAGTASGTGVFRCDPGLPNGAIVTKVQFTALSHSGSVGACALRRSGLTTATASTSQDLGRVDFGTAASGVSRLTDSVIENATVDNANWGYWLECTIPGVTFWDNPPTNGIYGADVIYTITAAKG